MDQTALVGMAERRCQVNGKAQKTLQIERLFSVPLKNAVERLTARVGENKNCPAFVSRERHGLGRPSGLKFGCERVFVFKASQTLGQRSFRRRSHDQKGHVVAALPGPVKHKFGPIADCLQQVFRSSFHCNLSERKPADQLNLARGAGGGQNLARVSGEITGRILEDGVPVASQGKRTLCIARNPKIRMVEQVISFHSNRNLPSFRDRKVFVQRCIKLRERRPAQDISSCIAKLTGRRYRKSTWIKPARRSAHSGPVRTDTRVGVADEVRTL